MEYAIAKTSLNVLSCKLFCDILIQEDKDGRLYMWFTPYEKYDNQETHTGVVRLRGEIFSKDRGQCGRPATDNTESKKDPAPHIPKQKRF